MFIPFPPRVTSKGLGFPVVLRPVGLLCVKDKSCWAHHEKVLEWELWVIMDRIYSVA